MKLPSENDRYNQHKIIKPELGERKNEKSNYIWYI